MNVKNILLATAGVGLLYWLLKDDTKAIGKLPKNQMFIKRWKDAKLRWEDGEQGNINQDIFFHGDKFYFSDYIRDELKGIFPNLPKCTTEKRVASGVFREMKKRAGGALFTYESNLDFNRGGNQALNSWIKYLGYEKDDLVTYEDGFQAAVAYIANGGKFAWSTSDPKKYRGVKEELGEKNVDKKYWRGILAPDAPTPQQFVDIRWSYDRDGDDGDVLAGVVEAIKRFSTAKQAQQYLKEQVWQTRKGDDFYNSANYSRTTESRIEEDPNLPF